MEIAVTKDDPKYDGTATYTGDSLTIIEIDGEEILRIEDTTNDEEGFYLIRSQHVAAVTVESYF